MNTALNTSGDPLNNSWTGGFTYDNNGNVLTTTDAKGTTITSTYDALNRPLTRTYNDSPQTATVTNTYGTTAPAIGKLIKVSSSVSETQYSGFDVLGRLTESKQITPLDGETLSTAPVRTSSYQYNLSGALIQQTYPSGRVVETDLDASGDIASVTSKKNSSAIFGTFANNFSYTADGKIASLKLGNGLFESAKLNSRSQVTEISMGHSVNDGSLMKLNYEYGELQTNGSVNVTQNAGNIAKQTVSFNGLANPFIQTYKYDSLNRITEAKETVIGNQTWIQTFGYDRFGNRNSHAETVNGQAKTINELTLPSVDVNTNRFSSTTNYEYDEVGNLIRDANGRQFIFNGDNKQTQVKDVSNNVVGTYQYDGNGKRVKKITASEVTVFVYDGMGKLVAEYSTATPPTNPTVNYTATDTLGSPRVLTDQLGQVRSLRDFMPFGEEAPGDSNYRTSANKYGTVDSVRQKFTGYQRDEETDLDFAEARYYYNDHGRFTAVDPLLASGKSADPQTFNRYAYTMNRPLILVDPTGLQAGRYDVPYEVPESEPTSNTPNTEKVNQNPNSPLALVKPLKLDGPISVDYPMTEDGSYEYLRGEGTSFSFYLPNSESGNVITDYTFTMTTGSLLDDASKERRPENDGVARLADIWVEGSIKEVSPGQTPDVFTPDPKRPPTEEKTNLVTVNIKFKPGTFKDGKVEFETKTKRDDNGVIVSSIEIKSCVPCIWPDEKSKEKP